MFTIREKKEGTEGSEVIVKLTDDELTGVAGGHGDVVHLGNGIYECSFSCDACGQDRTVIATLHTDMQAIVPGTYRCPKCGYTMEYEIRPNDNNMGYYIREWYPR